MHRLFVALRPPPAIRSLLLAATGVGMPGIRWQDDEQLHLTLRFVGAVERQQAEDVAAALSGIVAPMPEVRVDGVGSFEKRGRTDTLWARIVPADTLTALHRKVDQALGRAGIAPDPRRYLPHVTLARVARGGGDPVAIGRWLADHAALSTPPFALAHVVLYESHLGAEGARYEAVARWPLG
ncbi:RNA 2',3'-cyclic phosphodiesterase [Sphingomonas endophytica]|uniref:RNA 2',3'-cyclic phosphodiesterase n=1 Tax=Sphingomonas endophytica TaxID=869719 RepID=A0A147I6P3_9SPHN|nr:RNA 2',3'-cyclic phosphodiesterase [Sphingomonas endophytica]KTT74604.1 2'-5' RNA ligase [Sphingomonas endophytica]